MIKLSLDTLEMFCRTEEEKKSTRIAYHIAELLRDYMKKTGKSKADVAKELDVKVGCVGRLLACNTHIKLVEVFKVYHLLGKDKVGIKIIEEAYK